MSTTLYRKYRPQTFAEIAGHQAIKQVLQSEIINKKLAHAYLLVGPRGVGKTTFARLIAKAVNCLERSADSAEPCNNCLECQAIITNSSLSLVEIDGASNRRIDEIRALKEATRFVSPKGNFKVFIIDEVHMLTTEAFNALLKTLEEPPSHVIFVLATTELHKLPLTIISRTECFNLKRLDLASVEDRLFNLIKLEKIKVEDSIIKEIAKKSDGCLRDAESLLGQILAFGQSEISWEMASLILPPSNQALIDEFWQILIKKDLQTGFVFFDKLVTQGVDLEHFQQEMLTWLQLKLKELVTSGKTADSLKSLQKIIQILIKAYQESKDLPDFPLLSLELSLVDICKTSQTEVTNINKNAKSQTISSPVSENKPPNRIPKRSTSFPERKQIDIGSPQPSEPALPPVSESTVTTSQAKPLLNPTDNLKLDFIKSNWGQLLAQLKEYNQSLPVILNNSQPLKLTTNQLVVSVKFQLHQNILKKPENQVILKKVFKQLFNRNLEIVGQVVKKDPVPETESKSSPAEVSAASNSKPTNQVDSPKPPAAATTSNSIAENKLDSDLQSVFPESEVLVKTI